MGHYDDAFDFDNEEKLKAERGKVKAELTREINKITNINK